MKDVQCIGRQERLRITVGHDGDHQFGVRYVGASHLSPTHLLTDLRHHTAHLIYRKQNATILILHPQGDIASILTLVYRKQELKTHYCQSLNSWSKVTPITLYLIDWTSLCVRFTDLGTALG